MTQEALKMALDALETELSIDWGNQDEFNASAEKMHEAIAAIKEALVQQAQEPVCPECKAGVLYECVSCSSNNYPPQRTWVGLTDEQIDACWNKNLWKEKQPHHIFAKAIESKMKELNT